VNPQLIVCNISGYGPDGPYRDRKAYDLLVQAEAGLLSVTGTPDNPSKAGVSAADIAAGMYAYSNILAALIQRGKTGKGCTIEISMLEALAEWMSYPMYYAYNGAPPPDRAGASHSTIFPYGPFLVGDGSIVILGLQNEREWAAFCTTVLQQTTVLEDPRFAGNAERTKNRKALTDIIVAAFKPLEGATVIARLESAGIANAQLNEMADLWNHPQLKERDRWTSVGSPAGPLPALLPPGGFEGYKPRMDSVPKLGEHNTDVLQGLGYSPREINAFQKNGVV